MSMSRTVYRIAPWVVAMSAASTAPAGAAAETSPPVNALSPQGLSDADWSSIRAAYDAVCRAVVAAAGEYEARNPGQQWRMRFDGRGLLVRPDAGNWSWGLELVSYGFAGHECSVGAPARMSAMGECVIYERDDALTEWYINEQYGLEHGYTIHRRPAGASNGASVLRLAIALRGDLSAQLEDGGRDVRFVDASGAAVLRYSDLTVLDADGSTVSAWFELADGQLDLVVDDAGAPYPLTIDPLAQQAYLKASNTGAGDQFGHSVAVSGDTVVVGAFGEDSSAMGVNGDQSSNSASSSGAAYVFARNGSTWSQQAYLKASNAGANDLFGYSVAVSGDTAVVGAFTEDSSATGVDGDQGNNGASGSGAAYIFVRNGSTWSQQAYLKASNTGVDDWFGWSVAVSGDTVVVGAIREDSIATGVNGDQSNNNASSSGAAYVFVRSGTTWSQRAYLKASNTGVADEFGYSVTVSGDTVVVGAADEDSSATGVNGDQSNNNASSSGAAYVFVRNGSTWSQQAYLKASNTGAGDFFGISVAGSDDTAVIGAFMEDSSATGVNGDQGNNGAIDSGAAYVFMRNDTTWNQQAYLKASNTGAGDTFGGSVGVSGDTVLIGAFMEDSSATGVEGDQSDNNAGDSGAAYVFVRNGSAWSQHAYLKASNTDASDQFGESVAVSGDTVVAGARYEDSSATGVNGDESDNSAIHSGAAYIVFNPLRRADIDGDGTVGIADLLIMLADWGPCDEPCPPACASDVNADCAVGIADLLLLLADWSA